jgi:hypothetical protein
MPPSAFGNDSLAFRSLGPRSSAKAAKLGLKDEDHQAIKRLILKHPERGDMMQGTGGLRKMRFSPRSSGRGKSGSARVCYIVFVAADTCYLVTIFAKNEKPNLSDAEKAQVRKWVKQTKALLEPEANDEEESEA